MDLIAEMDCFFNPDFRPVWFCGADPLPTVAHQKHLCVWLLGRILRDGITPSSKQKNAHEPRQNVVGVFERFSDVHYKGMFG